MACHGVISAGAQRRNRLLDQAGDYAAFISNHSRYGVPNIRNTAVPSLRAPPRYDANPAVTRSRQMQKQ
jgi:hypothetical protein